MMIFDRLRVFLSADKRRIWLLVTVIAATAFLLFAVLSDGGGDDTGALDNELEIYREDLEGRLEELCASVRGVGRCTVSITFSEGAKYEYRGSNVSSSTPPRVMGVTVVCDGGESDAVKERIVDLMRALFDISSGRVAVLPRK